MTKNENLENVYRICLSHAHTHTMTTLAEFQIQLKAILGGKRIQNCSQEIKKKHYNFIMNNHPDMAYRERLKAAEEKREKIRQRHIREGTFQGKQK